MDLFNADFDKYVVAHCVSADFKMGAGIAVPIRKKFNLGGMTRQFGSPQVGSCCYHNNVLNLITKGKYYGKPSMNSMYAALVDMRECIERHGITQVVMPKIGSGLDRLSWPKVREAIHEVFENVEVEILVCHI